MKTINLHAGEELLFTYRQTELVLLKPLATIAAITIVLWFFFLKYDLTSQFGRILALLTSVGAIMAFRYWMMWHLRRYIITTNRLIHISHYGLFKKRVDETPLQRILNVSYKTTGLISSLFHFGDVEVQVVGLTEPIVLSHISHPSKIKDYLWELHDKYESTEPLVRAADIPKLEEKIGYETHKRM